MVESSYRELYEAISSEVPTDWHLLNEIFEQLDDCQSSELLDKIMKNNWPLTLAIRKQIKTEVSKVIGLVSGLELVEFDESIATHKGIKDLFVYYNAGHPYDHSTIVPELNCSNVWAGFERLCFTVDGYFDDFWESFREVFDTSSFKTASNVSIGAISSYDCSDRMFDCLNYFLDGDLESLEVNASGVYEGEFGNFWAPSLKSLSVKNLYLTKDVVVDLFSKHKMPRLEELKLGPDLDVNGNFVLQLIKREKFRLKLLDVSGMGVSGEGYESISKSESSYTLEELRVPTAKQDSKKFRRFCDEVIREDCFPALQRYSIGDKNYVKLDNEWLFNGSSDSPLVLSSYLKNNYWSFF
jgi:hypothetical protein